MKMDMKEKIKEIDGVEGVVPMGLSNHSNGNCLSKPSWLLLSIAELDERIQRLTINIPEKEYVTDSFGVRAEDYYQQRPHLLCLLHDLFNGYVSLADRYGQSLAKNKNNHHRRFSSPISPLSFESDKLDSEENRDVVDFDAESSSSNQQPFLSPAATTLDTDMIIADLVSKNVEYDIVLNELNNVEARSPAATTLDTKMIIADFVSKNMDYDIVVNELNIVEARGDESCRKIELQKSLLEVLESERLFLLNENATLRYRYSAMVEEHKEMASESSFMKRKAGELAKYVLEMREDHKVSLLRKKIEDLQGQIYGLEKGNKECCDQLVKKDKEQEINHKTKKGKNKNGHFDFLKSNGGKKGYWKKRFKF